MIREGAANDHTFASMFRACSSRSAEAAAVEIWQQLSSPDRVLGPAGSSALLQAAAKLPNPRTSVAVLRELEANGSELSTIGYNVTLNRLAKCDDWGFNEATQIFSKLRYNIHFGGRAAAKPDRYTFRLREGGNSPSAPLPRSPPPSASLAVPPSPSPIAALAPAPALPLLPVQLPW